MKTFMNVALLGLLGASGCGAMRMHDPTMMWTESWTEEGREMIQPPKLMWPQVRVDGLDGAHFTMQRGIFGEGLDVLAPFQGEFQPTGDVAMAAYRMDIQLDAATARRFGSDHPVHLKGKLLVPERFGKRGVLRIAPSECAMRALVTGDIEKLAVESEVMPTAEMACANSEHSGEMQRGEMCTMPAHRHESRSCGLHETHGGIAHHWKRAAELILSVAK
ncbi:MAG: hypothetical protein ABI321_20355 [Polyangia bacterium]